MEPFGWIVVLPVGLGQAGIRLYVPDGALFQRSILVRRACDRQPRVFQPNALRHSFRAAGSRSQRPGGWRGKKPWCKSVRRRCPGQQSHLSL